MSTKKEHTVKKILVEKIGELKLTQNARLDEIEKFVKAELAKINDRNKAVNGFVVGEVKHLMDTKLYNIDLTNEAIKELLQESNIIEDLDKKLAAKRAELNSRRQTDAEAAMKTSMNKENDAQTETAAQKETPPAEVKEQT